MLNRTVFKLKKEWKLRSHWQNYLVKLQKYLDIRNGLSKRYEQGLDNFFRAVLYVIHDHGVMSNHRWIHA